MKSIRKLIQGLMIILLAISLPAQAQQNKVYKARVLNEGALVYKSADFDSPVLGTLKQNQVYEVSRKAFAAFHRIRVGGKLGFIADNDIQPINFRFSDDDVSTKLGASKKSKNKKNTETSKSGRRKRKRPFELGSYVGPAVAMVNFTESTMGSKLSESQIFYGMKLSGTDILIEGDITTEINLMFHYGAPDYYEKYTGQQAAGWTFLSDFQLQTVSSLSPVAIGFFGFGPMFRFSKFDVALKDSGVATNYAATDMVLGMAFSVGVGLKMGSVALRSEYKYYWEKQQYSGLTAALQFEF